jgi:hypothetical protein
MEFRKPTTVNDGLTIYDTGQGEPLLLMPYPHGFGGVPMVEGPLAGVLPASGIRRADL